jgi:Trk-type K+ transport system membrane component
MYNPVETNFILYIFLAWTIIPYLIYLASSLNDPAVLATEGYDQSQVAGVGFFNILNTRHSGFNLVSDLTELDAGVLVMYIVLMSLPTLPFITAIFVDGDMNKPDLMSDRAYVMYLRNLRDLFGPYAKSVQVFLDTYIFQHNTYILVAYLLLAYSENSLMKETDQYTNLFSLLFEVISAYGNVGLSLVAPNIPYSFSGEFTALGKWIIIWVMMFGKHKGMPELYDEAVDFKFKELRDASRSSNDFSNTMEMSILPTKDKQADAEQGEDIYDSSSSGLRKNSKGGSGKQRKDSASSEV